LVAQNQVLFVDLLHGKALPGVAVPHQVHSTAGGENGDRLSPPRRPASATSPRQSPGWLTRRHHC
jgi:hypothetical protein